ncbi:GNAT family N-acetyltransferase [soil metagenome]
MSSGPASRPSPGRLALRPETAADESFRLALFRVSRGPGWDSLPPRVLDMIMAQQFHVQTQGYRAAHPKARLRIITLDDAPVGRLADDRMADAIHLIDIAITPPWRGRGVGTTVIRDLMNEAAAAALPLVLQTARDNLAAQQLYERLGFVTTSASATHLSMAWQAPLVDAT